MIRVLIVDDHPVVRNGLQGFLNAQPDLICAEAGRDNQDGSISRGQYLEQVGRRLAAGSGGVGSRKPAGRPGKNTRVKTGIFTR